jgi:hypothetical protein
LRFGNPGEAHPNVFEGATLSQLLQSCDGIDVILFYPGFQSKPWAEISQRFQRYFL